MSQERINSNVPVKNSTQVDLPEDSMIANRRKHADNVRLLGDTPFTNQVSEFDDIQNIRLRFSTAQLTQEVHSELEKYDHAQVASLVTQEPKLYRIVGRIIAGRSFGKMAFLRLRDHTGEIQIFCRKDKLNADFERLAFAGGSIEIADIISVEGNITVTKTGELSLDAQSIQLLTKAYRPLPEKWHGLQDVELRYRQRYVDLIANPEVANVFRARSLILKSIRQFLDTRGFIEVETPTLVSLIGGATARPFSTHHNALELDLFMRIAPELFLKRCLVGGLDRVYEIGRCYRNEGISTRHNPEFTMLEFYQAYSTYHTLMSITEQLLRFIDQALTNSLPEAYTQWKTKRSFTLEQEFIRVTMVEATTQSLLRTGISDFQEALQTGWKSVLHLFEKKGLSSIKDWAKQTHRKIDWSNFNKGYLKCENDGERLFALYEYFAEPFLAFDYRTGPVEDTSSRSIPVFITDHPFEISPLARRKDSDPWFTDRFELFIDGRELCNAFSELNDPDDQADRFREQVAKKARGAEETMDYDADYIRALEHGMPPAAGFGMGIDRLVMMLCNQPSIRDVILFPLLRPED